MKKEPIAIIGSIITVLASAAPQAVEVGLIPADVATVVLGVAGLLGTILGRSRVSPVE